MDKFSDQKRAYQHLYPTVDPFSAEIIDTGDGHHIYIEQCGNPQGRPVVVLHGGPAEAVVRSCGAISTQKNTTLSFLISAVAGAVSHRPA